MRLPPLLMVVILLSGAFIRLAIVFQPMEDLCAKVIPDDSFYYFQTARHIVAGHGSTFDGVGTHNGYHPAWMAMILPIFSLTGNDLSGFGPEVVIRAVLILDALLDLLAAFLVFYIGLRLTGSEILGILAATIHIFDPYALFHSVNGLETSLLGVAIAMVLLVTEKLYSGSALNFRQSIIMGIVLGFLMLTRTDSVLFAGPVLLVLLIASKDRRDALVKLTVAGAVASVIVLPWIVWGRLVIGIWGQTSGSAAPFELHLAFLRVNGSLSGGMFWRAVFDMICKGAGRAGTLSPLGYLIVPLLAVTVFAAIFYKDKRRLLLIFLPPFIYCMSLLIVHAGWRWMPRSWYYAPLYIFIALLVPVLIHVFTEKHKRAREVITVFLGIIFILISSISAYQTWQTGLWPQQRKTYKMSRRSAGEMPPHVKIGHSDAGIAAYFGPAGIINLDGTVSEPARRAIREGRLLKYCMDNNIKYIKIRSGLMLTEIMGNRFKLHLYPAPLGYMEISSNPWDMSERFEVPKGIINFKDDKADHFLLAGWSVTERYADPPQVWAVSENAEVVFKVPTGTEYLTISVNPFHHLESKYHSIGIYMDDVELKSAEMAPGWQIIKAEVPANKADNQIHILKFHFDPPPSFTPKSLGMWPDDRTLAAAISQIKLVP